MEGDPIDDRNNPTTQLWWRTGLKDFYDEMHLLLPERMQMGNIADWGGASTTDPQAIAPLHGLLHGGVMEYAIGPSNAPETWDGTTIMMDRYKYTVDVLAEPKLMIFEQSYLTADGSDPTDPTPY